MGPQATEPPDLTTAQKIAELGRVAREHHDDGNGHCVVITCRHAVHPCPSRVQAMKDLHALGHDLLAVHALRL